MILSGKSTILVNFPSYIIFVLLKFKLRSNINLLNYEILTFIAARIWSIAKNQIYENGFYSHHGLQRHKYKGLQILFLLENNILLIYNHSSIHAIIFRLISIVISFCNFQLYKVEKGNDRKSTTKGFF